MKASANGGYFTLSIDLIMAWKFVLQRWFNSPASKYIKNALIIYKRLTLESKNTVNGNMFILKKGSLLPGNPLHSHIFL